MIIEVFIIMCKDNANERRISSLLEYFAEMQLIFCKDTNKITNNLHYHCRIIIKRLTLWKKLKMLQLWKKKPEDVTIVEAMTLWLILTEQVYV